MEEFDILEWADCVNSARMERLEAERAEVARKAAAEQAVKDREVMIFLESVFCDWGIPVHVADARQRIGIATFTRATHRNDDRWISVQFDCDSAWHYYSQDDKGRENFAKDLREQAVYLERLRLNEEMAEQ